MYVRYLTTYKMTKGKEIFKLADLITKSIKGDISEEESQQLKQWEESSLYNRDLLRSIKDENSFNAKLNEYSTVDWEADYSEFIQKKHKRDKKIRLFRFAKYAAAILLPVAIAGAFFLIDKPDYGKDMKVAVIEAGKSKATLTLANGEIIDLSTEIKQELKEEDGSSISRDSGKISYSINKQVVAEAKIDKPIYNKLYVPRGGEYFLTLGDGTKVWLNSDTKLRYPVAFTGKKRQVYLEGEAYFDVTKNAEKPFIVSVKDANVKVLGTSFNVKAYNEEDLISTTLVEGKVSFKSEKLKKELVLAPGEQGNVISESGALTKKKVDVSLYTSWKDGRMAFKGERMEDILRTLSRWYDVEIFYMNEKCKDILFTGDVKRYNDFNSILKIIEITNLVRFKAKGRTITVLDK